MCQPSAFQYWYVNLTPLHQLEDIGDAVAVEISEAQLVGRRGVISQFRAADGERILMVIEIPPLVIAIGSRGREEKIGTVVAELICW